MSVTELIAPNAYSPFSIFISDEASDIEDAQSLRYDVFHNEMGADLPFATTSPLTGRLLDTDGHDHHCIHLLARDTRNGKLAGCYRMMTPEGAVKNEGRLFIDSLFDLSPALEDMRSELVEIGRATVSPDYRGEAGVQILLLAGILGYQRLTGYKWGIGCMSARMNGVSDNQGNSLERGQYIRTINEYAVAHRCTDPELFVTPKFPVEVDGIPLAGMKSVGVENITLPPMIANSTRVGGVILGDPSYDSDFDMSDFVLLVGIDMVSPETIAMLDTVLSV